MVDMSATPFEFLSFVEYFRPSDVIPYESVTLCSTLAGELFKMTFDLSLAWSNLRCKDIHYKFLNSTLFPRRDTHWAVKLTSVSTKPTPPEQPLRFWCICITRCTSDIIRETRNKGALHRWNKASAVRPANRLCLAWVSASSHSYQSWEKLYERKSIQTFSFALPGIKSKKSKQKERNQKKILLRDCSNNEIEDEMLIWPVFVLLTEAA